MLKHAFLYLSLLLLPVLAIAQPANPPVGGNWAVVDALTDGFGSFNSGKWVKRNFDSGPEGHRWRGRAPGEFHRGQSTVQNGRLRITATAKYDPGNEQTNCDFWMRTGFVYSQTKMKLGWYTECLMRASDLSMASSFWLKLGTINNQEIDVTETYGNGRNTRWWDDKVRSNTHFFQNGQDFASNPPPIDVTNGAASTFPRNQFYRVGMHWKSSTQMDIYVNGTRRQTLTVANNKQITEDLRLIWDMEPFVPACGSGPGAPDYEHIRPNNPTRRNYMEVEWVKTWRPTSGGGTGGTAAPIGSVIWLRAANGSYVTAEGTTNRPLEADRPRAGSWERFRVINAGGGKIALRAMVNGQYVAADRGINATTAPLVANRGRIGSWEQYDWIPRGAGKVALKARSNGKYVQARINVTDAPLWAIGGSIQGWETFNWGLHSNQAMSAPATIDAPESVATQVGVAADPEMIVFPNPVTRGGTINVTLPETVAEGMFTLIDLQGREIIRQPVFEANYADLMPPRDLPAGVYLLRLNTEEGQRLQRRVVIH